MTPDIFQNLEFFVLLPFAIALILLLRISGATLFKLGVLAVSLIFILCLPGISWPYVVFIGSVLIVSWILASIMLKLKEKKASALSIYSPLILLTVTILFAYIKYPSVNGFVSGLDIFGGNHASKLMPILGFSFLGLKLYSLFADISAGRVKAVNPINFACYFLFFPTFLAGPIDRFQTFSNSLKTGAETKPTLETFKIQMPRFVLGCFKTFVIVGILHKYALPFLELREITSVKVIYIGLVAYYWYEYVNFSGYSDLAVSTSKMMGIDAPENFNKPFLATSLTDLWRRWHISLANWLRDYIYYPLLYKFMKWFPSKSKFLGALLSAVAIFITFTLCGLWHGEAIGMILFGVLSGLVLGAEIILTQMVWPKISKKVNASPTRKFIYNSASRVVAFHIAILTFGPVLLSYEKIQFVLYAVFRV